MITEVRNWLGEQGFTLEMRTAAAFRAEGFEVRQSSHYIDSESGKGREIDVIAHDPDSIGIIDIIFVVECKSSKKPWAMLCSPDTLVGYNRYHAFGVLSKKAIEALVTREVELFERWPWLKKDGVAAYSVRQVFSDSDAAYAAAVTVAKASDSWIRQPDSAYSTPYVFAFPILVVNSPILQCTLAEDGQIEVAEVSEGEWLFFAKLPEWFGTCIRVVSLEHLPTFVREAKAFTQQLRAEFKPEQEKVLKSWRRGPK
jgi:hypothetical protein